MADRTNRGRWTVLAAALLALSACDAFAPPTPEQQFEEAISADPAFDEMYTVMREEFPRDFARFRAQMITIIETSDDPRAGFDAARSFMLEFINANAGDLAAAPDPILLETRDANIALIEQLAADDDRLCGNFAMRGLQFGDIPSEDAKELLGRVTALQLRTIAAGREQPTQRGEPNESDVSAYVDALRQHGMQQAEIDAFLAGTLVVKSYPPADECRMGLAVYRSLADIPADASARISAVMLVPTG